MKTPEEIKKGLECCMDYQSCTDCGEPKCPYNDMKECVDALLADALALIRQTDASYRQLSKALCGKENATLDELLRAVEQVKQNKPGTKLICQINVCGEEALRKALDETEVDGKPLAEWIELSKGQERLEQELESVKRERDALLNHPSIRNCDHCEYCKCDEDEFWAYREPCTSCCDFSKFSLIQLRPENTEVQGNG